MKNPFDTPIFVLGLPRSGTSLVAGALSLSNVWTGRTVQGGASNPKGFFEHIILREEVNKKILEQLDCDPLGVTKLPALETIPVIPGLRETIYSIIANEGYGGKQPWLFKDAKLTLTWPALLHAFPEARWIIVRRDVESIINSCLNTPFMNQHSDNPALWRSWTEDYISRLEMLKSRCTRCREIWPQELINGNLAPLKDLVDDLGLQWDEKTITHFIDRGYWHSTDKPTP